MFTGAQFSDEPCLCIVWNMCGNHMAMDNPPCIDDDPIKPSTYGGCPIATFDYRVRYPTFELLLLSHE